MTAPSDQSDRNWSVGGTVSGSGSVPAWIGSAVLVVLIILGLTTGTTSHVTSGRVLVIGDSLTEGSEAEVHDALTAAGWDAVVDGRGGWTIGLWRKPLVEVASFVRPDVAVVALGTNDCNTSCMRLGPVIDDIIVTLVDAGTSEILWINVQESAGHSASSGYVNDEIERAAARWIYVNDEIERAAVRWPQVRIIDLDTEFAAHPEWHLEDGVHFTDLGSQQFGALIANALAASP